MYSSTVPETLLSLPPAEIDIIFEGASMLGGESSVLRNNAVILDSTNPLFIDPETKCPVIARIVAGTTTAEALRFEEATDLDDFLLFDLSGLPLTSRDSKYFGSMRIHSSVNLLLVNRNLQNNREATSDLGFKGIRRNEIVRIGLDDPVAVERFNLGRATARRHFVVSQSDQGIKVRDVNSERGTTIITSSHKVKNPSDPRMNASANIDPHASRDTARRMTGTAATADTVERFKSPEPDYANALAMHPNELWSRKNNGGRTQDPEYIRNYQVIRNRIVEAFQTGRLYDSAASFVDFLKEIHTFVGKTGDYNRLGQGNISTRHLGEFSGPGQVTNDRIEQSIEIASLARRYGDAYGIADRFTQGRPSTESESFVNLPHIAARNMPYDVVRYDEHGKIKSMDENYSFQRGYQFFYPRGESINHYMLEIQRIGGRVEDGIKGGVLSSDHILDLIARQYQYGACARPFRQINNSLFMQLANAQVKMLGLKGMTHGEMDIAAQRLQPDTFAKYFADRAIGIEP